ncbi:hypothetical protein BC937DRAFT_88893 [Endogone sp. FLAS-F59071]|nr:hypothetical protein BC937DRAFT_88893 [Endogone sp. FLAS-F59071]|eukprot:RUS23426.1 hypothetical protein BC937DRAFT_88893 [Endogone sp. FLAS-F59071]
MDHLIYNCRSNAHLQFAITKYGLAVFCFKVIELCSKEVLFEREQYWLDWLFSLPMEKRYNFSPTAGSMTGYTHSPEAKAKISASKKATAVTVTDLEGNILVNTPTVLAAAEFMGVAQSTASSAIKRGTVVKNNSH